MDKKINFPLDGKRQKINAFITDSTAASPQTGEAVFYCILALPSVHLTV